ncbi:hypothetical protein Q6T38_001271 [Campylobacter upsaliensis]|uniref:Bacteriocin-type signal sequence domain-containing protein n=1 Tax=Campylobacter upsaliensis TaxID=28080 RepID=A0A5L8SV56_CAMUP|nr:hypothetical protein [Campylobacter upsaliensis]EAH5879115.1 hypothetical protein [Campylobacter upsaliensis]EAH6260066.1 hypothetical protein [Campylobacter upsaliensis]EAH6864110.1 hypothetical protein [Campylobacter upsaliensis]EAI3670874.1 hypothetical protein [Campylobacter upsaliensis]EAI5357863.1 hypothetical protein [Campylobacter upsaliensis]
MFQKLFSVIALSALLVSFSFANDLLAKLSNGAVSDNSVGVKILSLDEMKEVRGGYRTSAFLIAENEYLALAIPDQTTTYGQAVAIYSITNDDTLRNVLVGYTVKRNIGYSKNGSFVYFTYGVAMVDKNGVHRVNMNSALNNNLVIKELSRAYKEDFERRLGGLR